MDYNTRFLERVPVEVDLPDEEGKYLAEVVETHVRSSDFTTKVIKTVSFVTSDQGSPWWMAGGTVTAWYRPVGKDYLFTMDERDEYIKYYRKYWIDYVKGNTDLPKPMAMDDLFNKFLNELP